MNNLNLLFGVIGIALFATAIYRAFMRRIQNEYSIEMNAINKQQINKQQ